MRHPEGRHRLDRLQWALIQSHSFPKCLRYPIRVILFHLREDHVRAAEVEAGEPHLIYSFLDTANSLPRILDFNKAVDTRLLIYHPKGPPPFVLDTATAKRGQKCQLKKAGTASSKVTSTVGSVVFQHHPSPRFKGKPRSSPVQIAESVNGLRWRWLRRARKCTWRVARGTRRIQRCSGSARNVMTKMR